jgi:hypothetical protein
MSSYQRWLAIATLSGLCVALGDSISYGASITVKGSGDHVTDVVSFWAGLLMVGAAHKGHRNFVVELLSADGEKRELLMNTIGDYQGVRLISVDAGQYRFQVQSDLAWVLMHEQPDSNKQGTPLPISHSHTGDAPLGPFAFNRGLLRASFTHEGTRNFVATLFTADGSKATLLVNKIGVYNGTVTASITEIGSYWLEVQASGVWSANLVMGE